MTWFKNSIKLLVLGFAVVSVATTQNSYAIDFSSMPNFTLRTPGTYNGSPQYRYDMNYLTRYADGSHKGVSVTRKSSWSPNFIHLGTSPYFTFTNSLGYATTTDYWDFQILDIYSNYIHNYIPRVGVVENFDGESVVLDNIWFGNNTFVLYNDDLTHTLQYLGNYKIKDYILFIDPLTSSAEDSSIDNFFLISIPKLKAWSLKMVDPNINTFYYGDIGNFDVKTFPYTNSYTLLQSTNTTPFPKFSQYMSSNKSYLPGDIGFLYNKDGTFIAPDFGNNGGSVSPDSPTYNTDLINYYNSCVNKGENLRKSLQLLTMCKNQDTEIDADNIIIDTGLNYTGTASYCLQLDNFIVNVYNAYSGNWNNGLVNDTANLQDINAPFNDLIFSWYYHSVFLDENYNISGLPVGNSWCSVYSNEVFIDDNKTFVEKVSDELTNMFGTGIAGKYIESVNEHSSFSGLITAIKDGSSDYFSEYLFDPFEEMFNSGYNAFHNQFGVSSCSEIQSVFGEFQLGNIALYIVGALFIFILIMCF